MLPSDKLLHYLSLLKQKTQEAENYKTQMEMYKSLWLKNETSSASEFLIFSTEFDADSIDIIGQNIRQIGEITYENGFLLTTRQECDRNYGIYLSQLNHEADMTKTIKIIEDFVEKKQIEKVENRRIYPSENLPEARKSFRLIGNNMQMLRENMDHKQMDTNRLLTEASSELETEINRMDDAIALEKSISHQNRMENFFNQESLELVRKERSIMSTICERMSTRKDNKKPPLMGLSSEEDKWQQLNSYMDFIQSQQDSCEMHRNIEEWLCNSWKHLVFSPSIDKLSHIPHDVMMTKYLLDHDVIATLHFVTLPQNTANSKCLALVIIDQRIAYRFCKQKQDSLQYFYKTIRRDPHWPVNKKIATSEAVDDKHKQLFVYNDNKEMYENNDNVVRWIENNFKRLQHVCEGTFLNSIPSMYNLLFYLFVDCQQ